MKVNSLRGARVASSLKESMNAERERRLDEIIPLEENDDPYRVDDNDEDETYKPSPKKRKVDIVSEKLKKPKQKNPKQLTRQQRLERLKNKTVQYDRRKASSKDDSRTQNSITKSTVTGISSVNKETPTTSNAPTRSNTILETSTISNSNHDSFFHTDSTQTQNREQYFEINQPENQNCLLRSHTTEQHLGTVDEVQTASNMPILSTILARMDKLSESFELLRRQVARVEAKSTYRPSPGHMQNSHAPGAVIDNYMDFNATLASEGIPVSTSKGVDDLENKLKDSLYHEKLVRKH